MERLIQAGRLEEARCQLAANTSVPPKYGRQLLIKALERSESWKELKELLQAPETGEDLALYVVAAERSGDLSGVEAVLNLCEKNDNFDSGLVSDLKKRISVRLSLKG